jgi:hypothetical protein
MGKMLRPLEKKKRVIIDQTPLDNWQYKIFLLQALTLKLSENLINFYTLFNNVFQKMQLIHEPLEF